MDRVEAAYLAELIARPDPAFGLLRSRYGYLLLDQNGLGALQGWLTHAAPGGRDLLSRLPPVRDLPAQEIETAVRSVAIARSVPRRLRACLAKAFPEGFDFYNTGHSNLTPALFAATRDGTAHVLVHDVIPLDHPEYQRPGTVEAFARRMQAVSRSATRCIYTTQTARTDAERHMERFGRVPPAVVAPLGLDLPELAPAAEAEAPYFLALGTIEPRKNHALLLDVWDRLLAEGGDVPLLKIVGKRGWNNAEVFDRLDDTAHWQGRVQELGGVADEDLAPLIAGAQALLFPSLAEGYGLPPLEAAALGVPVVCNTLPVYRETLGNIPIYADASDQYQWEKAIRMLAEASVKERKIGANGFRPPVWSDHFATVFGS
ncbi:glycosyltransferase family 4 protein [Pseudoruegeria sp. SHC-113]|uniref:glycosyltransferase family 4 protein n=1 Tax=Pseudoruegeria sp. SHC-113 TaxID=2855439 RepID=UPI0021BA85AB|nr:glycosyltransferase family 1 protein [Pseudoruegeria sp. SHC-113]MCT8158516.1 glycosyltransferase family 4 protein [Pseudoruegeria sp. SHC-113]